MDGNRTMSLMRLYHTTPAAGAIRKEGFRDGTGTYLTKNVYTGVWLSDCILDINEGASGEDVLVLEIPEEIVKPYEWIQEMGTYREFLVPAEIVNQYPIIGQCDIYDRWDPPL
jgi:hypothetical protein